MVKQIEVVELFAGVGGFRCGLERVSTKQFHTVWANQWEPSSNVQHAFNCYKSHYGNTDTKLSNEDIGKVWEEVPEHQLLVGGFPCQDYSVASTGAKGIEGKKGVLWWYIRNIIESKRPKYVLLENVDRLLRSPRGTNRGRDFSIILRCLYELDYVVEWRVINAADYGEIQRRRRTFIFASKSDVKYSKSLENLNPEDILYSEGFFQKYFPIHEKTTEDVSFIELGDNAFESIQSISDTYSEIENGRYYRAGFMRDGHVYTRDIKVIESEQAKLRSIMQHNVAERFFINDPAKEERIRHMKGRKADKRIAENGFEYYYSEGQMSYPDSIDKPARTLLTSEGTINRSTHFIPDGKNPDGTDRIRILTPEECELINGFDIGWTNMLSMRARYFTMGNALVVPLIEKMGKRILEID